MRRPTAPAKARPPAVASAGTLEADANRLIAAFRLRAYSEARRLQRQARATPAAAHWADVARLIAQRRGESRDVDLAGAQDNLPALRPIRFFEVDPLDEFERVLALKPQRFRLQFFGVGPDLSPSVLTETEIRATDASGAIHAAAEAAWPPRAVGLRVLDQEGREIFERLKADMR